MAVPSSTSRISDVLTYSHRQQLQFLLDDGEVYRELLKTLRDPRNRDIRYYIDNINIRRHLDRLAKSKKSCSDALISDYSTKNATLQDLLDALVEAKLFEAANFIRTEVLNLEPIQDNSYTMNQYIEELCQEQGIPVPYYSHPEQSPTPMDQNELHHPDAYVQFPYHDLWWATNGFGDGSLLGQGGFSTVFRALLGTYEVAVKRLNRDDTDAFHRKQMDSEIKLLTGFKHPNLLRVLGASLDGPERCIVYEYMSKGDLQRHLQCLGGNKPLPGYLRFEIAVGISRGLHHLHTKLDKPVVHRDIKSANILLDANFTPKIGDYGSARFGASGDSATFVKTLMIVWSKGYAAPELVLSGSVTAEMDIYSLGVVFLELITGDKPYDEMSQESLVERLCDAKSHDIFLDTKAENWQPRNAPKILWEIAWRCLEAMPVHRPNMTEVLAELLKTTAAEITAPTEVLSLPR